MKVKLISHTPDPQRLIETCARISYDSKNEPFDPKVNSEFIRKLIKNGHESPLEHASATFLIEDISRACSHQIVRHRLASYSQQSGRYTRFKFFENGYDGTLPAGFEEKYRNGYMGMSAEDRRIFDVFSESVMSSCNAYDTLRTLGVPLEDARFVLPQGCWTSLYMTANFREWRHFLQLRLDRHAQWEIRAVACEVYEKLSEIAQDVFEDLASEYQSNFVAGG